MSDKKIIYSYGGKEYAVNKFTDESKIAFACLHESNQEINSLTRKITILQAAAVALSQKINEQLTDEMRTTLDNFDLDS